MYVNENYKKKKSTRLIVISDLHLGGDEPTMCSRPDVLASFIEQLPCRFDCQIRVIGDVGIYVGMSIYRTDK